MRWRYWAAVVLGFASAVASASERDLAVPADKGWQHATTGLILPASLDGLAHTKLIDLTTGEYDVVASFAGPQDPVFATVYVFRPTIASVPMWFERSEWMIEHRDAYGSAVPTSPDPVGFAPPGTATPDAPASALRRAYAPTGGRLKSTALAVMPLGPWLVAVRMSSSTLAPSALDARMSRVIAAIRWPATIPPAPAATPIAACAVPIAFRKAKPKKQDGSNALMTLLLGAAMHDPKLQAKAKAAPAVAWCRDPGETDAYAVYRADAGPHPGYTLALGDASRTIVVSATLDTITGKDESYAVSLADVDGTTTSFPAFVGLPTPDQALATVRAGHATGSSSGDGRQINVNAATFAK